MNAFWLLQALSLTCRGPQGQAKKIVPLGWKKGTQLAPLMRCGPADFHGPSGESAISAPAAAAAGTVDARGHGPSGAPLGVTPSLQDVHCPLPLGLPPPMWPKIQRPLTGSRSIQVPWHQGSTTTLVRLYGPAIVSDSAITQRESVQPRL